MVLTTTQPGVPTEPCVRVPPAYEASFAEILADYARRKDTPAALERAFQIAKPYVLLNRDEIKEFEQAHETQPGANANPRQQFFQGVTDLIGLIDVYFNHDRTLALTGISTYCGSLCASYAWKIFEKVNAARWEERPWVNCATMA